MTPEAPPLADADRYRIGALIGCGRSGLVYRAYDRELGLDVALKTIPAPEPGSVYELKREFRELADVAHPNLVELYDLRVEDERCFFTMELVEGPPLHDWVRAATGGVDATRLATLALQLAHGLAVLHRAGKLHRDVKPSNAGLTADGRAVLLDFGLATALGATAGGHLAGTPAHMAPEQLWGRPLGPSADWYALGSLLFELATGGPPFPGDAARVAAEKSACDAPSLASLAPALPAELTALVDHLLARSPDARPAGGDVVGRLEALLGQCSAGGGAPLPSVAEVFVGRTAELAVLARAYERAAGGQLATVRLSGPSGIGKTALVHAFLAQLPREALVVHGRCHPYEHVPFNAFDRLVDELGSLVAAPSHQGPLPADVACLRRLFPTLERIPDPPGTPPRRPPSDPVEVRRRGFGALRELLATLGARRPVVLWIDDLQWADADSGALLAELLRAPAAPPLLVVVSHRDGTGERLPEAASAALHEAEPLPVGPLADEETARLLRTRHGGGAAAGEVERLVRLADGSPFVALQLAEGRLAATAGPHEPDLGRLLAERFAALAAPARRLLELAAVAGRPLAVGLALDAAALPAAERLSLRRLERERLVRRAHLGPAPTFEPYHDRIREALLEALAPERRRASHQALAAALERRADSDPEEIFAHFLSAGDAAAARRHGEQAGDRATAATAFERAADLYRQTLALGLPATERLRMLEKLGDALTNAGRCGEAGGVFGEAARAATGHHSDPSRRLHLRYRHALEYLRGGHWQDGRAALDALLAELDLAVPVSSSGAVLRLVAQRARLLARRWHVQPDRHVPDARRRQRLDVLWKMGRTLAMFDPVVGDLLVVRHCLEALDAHDPAHVAMGLATEAAKSAQIGGGFLRRRSRRMLARADALLARLDDAEARLGVLFGHVVTAYEEGRWRACHEAAVRLIDDHLEGAVGVSWERSTADAYRLTTLAHMGRFTDAGAPLPGAIAAAEERGDRYAVIGLRSSALSLVWLADDRPADLMHELDEAMRPWEHGRDFQIQHYLHIIAAVQAALYRGDAQDAWRRLDAAWPGARRAQFLRLETPAIELRGLRARTALRRAATASPTDRRPLRRLVRAEARRISHARVAWAPAAAALLRAACDAWDAPERAAAGLLEAARLHERADMPAHAAADRLAAAWVTGETDVVAREALRAAGVRRPEALAAALTGLPLDGAPAPAR